MKDPRPFDDRPLALTLLDYYRALVRRREDLRATEKKTTDDRKALVALSEILDAKDQLPSVLEKIDEATRPESSGDSILDEWYAALDRGEIPKDLVIPPPKKQGERWPKKSPKSA